MSPFPLSRFSLSLFLLGVVWAVQLAALGLNLAIRRTQTPALLGNRPANVSALAAGDPGQEGTFSFTVFGDIDGGQIPFEEIYDRMRMEPTAFEVLIGDIAHTGELYHRYFDARLVGMALDRPVFVAAGNHDIDPEQSSVQKFETKYGPADFSFIYGGCLFVILGRLADPAYNAESLAFLERTLREQGPAARWRFVFLHYPPPAGPDYPGYYLKDGARFVDCLARYHADYVFSGHVHRFMAFQRDSTRYLLVGSSGSRLRKEYGLDDAGKFHHSLKLTVSPQGVRESLWVFEPVTWWHVARRGVRAWLTFFVGEWLLKHRAAAAGANAGLALAALAWCRLGKRRPGHQDL